MDIKNEIPSEEERQAYIENKDGCFKCKSMDEIAIYPALVEISTKEYSDKRAYYNRDYTVLKKTKDSVRLGFFTTLKMFKDPRVIKPSEEEAKLIWEEYKYQLPLPY